MIITSYKCPKCNQTDGYFEYETLAPVQVTINGSGDLIDTEECGDPDEMCDADRMTCSDCGHEASVKLFTVETEILIGLPMIITKEDHQ